MGTDMNYVVRSFAASSSLTERQGKQEKRYFNHAFLGITWAAVHLLSIREIRVIRGSFYFLSLVCFLPHPRFSFLPTPHSP
jgi:hypothetical protein